MSVIVFLEKALSIIFWGLIIFGFDTVSIAILTIVCALIHEIGHLAVLCVLKKNNSKIPHGKIFGFRISVKDLSYKEEMLVALGGPLINFAIAVLSFVCASVNKNMTDYLHIFGFLNIMTMISNLLPISGYDGYKTIEACAMIFFDDPFKVKKVLSVLSFLFSSIMCFVALYFMLKLGEGYWIFAIFLSTVISEIVKTCK